MKLDDMNEILSNGPTEFTGQCCDCEADVLIKAEMFGMNLIVEGGAMFRPPTAWHCPTEYMFKCPACFEKDSKFYPKTEIFTRCVGYLRPKNQMHDGKLAEVAQRSMFDMATI